MLVCAVLEIVDIRYDDLKIVRERKTETGKEVVVKIVAGITLPDHFYTLQASYIDVALSDDMIKESLIYSMECSFKS